MTQPGSELSLHPHWSVLNPLYHLAEIQTQAFNITSFIKVFILCAMQNIAVNLSTAKYDVELII